MISRLENDMQKTLVWFESNMMVANPCKFQFMFMGLGHDHKLCMEIDEMVITTVQQTLSRVDPFENAVFLLSCGRLKTGPFENATSHQTMHWDLWGSREGSLFVCFRISNKTAFRVEGDSFKNAPRADADLSTYG